MFKPVLPYVTDNISHLLFFNDHINTVHKHQGKYHVHTEVAEAAKNDQQEKSTNSLNKETAGNEYIVFETTAISSIPLTPIDYFSFNSMFGNSGPLNHDYPPPRI